MGIRTQNMPQTSNSLLTPNKSWLLGATNGNQDQTMLPTTANEIIDIKS